MCPAITRSRIRNDHTHILLRNSQALGQIAANTEWTLCAGPDSEFLIFPFGYCGARLERHVGNVSDGIGLLQLLVRDRQAFFHRTLVPAPATSPPATSFFLRGFLEL